jgi:chaperonin GroES
MIHPIKDRLVIKPDTQDEVTKTGIVLPQNAENDKFTGKVLAIGPEVREVAEGDEVIYSRYAGIEVDDAEMDEGDLLIVREPDVLAVKR